MGWFFDFLRLAWGLVYWNTRKSIHRLRRRRGRCPCQHPSDSGRAHETACAAVTGWNDPQRFRRLCPLLEQTPSGLWRCSVNAADVRPFWGRALTFYGGSVAVIYLVAALAVLVVFKNIGYKVTYAGVLWPPAWDRFTAIRSEFFLEKFRSASADGDMRTALMALSTAYGLDPAHYHSGWQLAQFWQVSHPAFSDQIYDRLLREHPDRAEETAQSWFRALLARGDFIQIEKLAAARIAATPASPGAWTGAFIFANRRTGNTAACEALSAIPALAPSTRFLIILSADLTRLPSDALQARLIRAADEAGDALSFYTVCRQLIDRKFAQSALTVIERREGLLGRRDQVALRLDALASLGWKTTLYGDVATLLIPAPNATVVELLCAHLLRYPDPEVTDLLFARLDQSPLPKARENYPAYLSVFFVAVDNGRAERVNWTIGRIRGSLDGGFASLDSIAKALLGETVSRRIIAYLPTLQPLPLDVSYALLDRHAAAP